MSDFETAIAVVLRHEGGFQRDPQDRGNWTGGHIGVGELKGTNMGISAMSYPNEDIEHLTRERAEEIYERDYWMPGPALLNDQGVATKILDIAVTMERNGRHGPAIEILQKAICACGAQVEVDGTIGTETATAANQIDGTLLLPAIKLAAVQHYQDIVAKNPGLAKWLPGWIARAKS